MLPKEPVILHDTRSMTIAQPEGWFNYIAMSTIWLKIEKRSRIIVANHHRFDPVLFPGYRLLYPLAALHSVSCDHKSPKLHLIGSQAPRTPELTTLNRGADILFRCHASRAPDAS